MKNIASYRRRHGIRIRQGDVAATDKRTPLLRLLQDCRTRDDHIEISYARQWPTFFKAQREGYIDSDGNLTDKAKDLLT